VCLAALMHDIGEMIMDSPSLRKGGQLEFKHKIELWRHPIIGEQQLAKRELPRQAQLLVRWHHEWWNGSGYPDMLNKETIPVGARILRLVDTYDALTANRPYREAFCVQEAKEIIEKSAGIEFDPYLVKIFLEMLEEMFVPELPKMSQTIVTDTNQIFEEPPQIAENLITDHSPNTDILENETKLEIPNNLPINLPISESSTNPDDSFRLSDQELIFNPHSLVSSNSEKEDDQEISSSNSTDISEPMPNLGTQPLFTPSSDLARDLLNTSYLSEPTSRVSTEDNSLEKTNNLLTTYEENTLDKSQENAENKPE
jgi:hypothetical protein